MSGKVNVFKIWMGLIIVIAASVPQLSFADWGVGISIGGPGYYHEHAGGYYRWHDHPQYGWHIHHIPGYAFVVWVGGTRYYYADGLYYQYIGDGDYMLVNPPYGAYVSSIPPDFQPVIVNGRTYYTDNGVYYVLTPHGYRVVHQPTVVAPPVEVVQTPPVQQVVAQGSYPVNIPNGNGSYTTVVIRQSGSGYVGPQGEFYQTFPSVSQLKAMYSK